MKKSLISSCIIGLLVSTNIQAQQVALPTSEISKSIEERFSAKNALQQQELKALLQKNKLPELVISPSGRFKQARFVTPTGHIIYYTTDNIGAGRTLSTNKVWPGGTAGTSLTGQNMPNRLGVWDGGKVLNTHQEFGGRVTQPDGASSLSDHATHVAATMIASGVDANAKGMAYMATIKAYDWSNDDVEMIQAAQAGMLISNHSYGSISGWYYSSGESRWEWYGDPNISNIEDYKFGCYTDQAKDWDEIATTYPNYLICKSAGNDRGDNKSGSTWYYSNGNQGSGTAPGQDGGASGYDCISTNGNAKNILTVGAVEKIGGNSGNGWTQTSDVVMSSFSGWGPTDDGRVKPDIVSPGVSVKSAISTGTTNYDTYNGTSMATPAASGSLLLVQQHYFARKNAYMRSATLKGLVIHTADEAGTIGPDYKFGWGLMNTASAVKFINDSNINRLQERTLTNGQPQSMQFSADAGKPLRVTICWTDVPGTPVTTGLLDNTKKMLVNDLDIRLVRNSDNTPFNPYILNPASPANPATTGDNTVDNVEMIHIAAPLAGNYTLTISHKGILSGTTQRFSLFISNGVEKPLALFTTNRSTICPGQTVNFTDNSSGAITQRTWYFPGGTPSTSTATNPVVTYPNSGYYSVALKVTGGLGTDSVYKTDYINVGGLALPFTETFESNSATASSWKIDNPDANKTWEATTISGTTPGNIAMSVQCFDYNVNNAKDGLISPVLNFKSYNNISLSFKHAYTRYNTSSPTDSLVVWVSTNCGSTWQRVASYGENGTGTFATYGKPNINTYSSDAAFIPASANEWCGGATGTASCKTISLNQFVGQPSVQIKFECVNRYSNNLYIDNIVVNGDPLKPVANFQASKTTTCVGEQIKLTDLSEHMPNAWVWTITGATPSSPTVKNPSIVFANPGQYAVKLKVTNLGGADSIEIANYITVVPAPLAPNIKASGATAFCIGDSVLLRTDSIGNNNWYANEVLIAQNIQQLYAKDSATYRVARSNGTCEASSSLLIKAAVKPVTPIITSSVTGVAFCTGGNALLTSNNATGNQWYKNGTLITNATTNTYTATDSGSYTLVATPNGCPSDISAAKTFALLPRPTVGTISGTVNPTRGEGTTYTVPEVSGYTYIWSITKGTILSGNNTDSVSARFNTLDTSSISVSSKSAAGCLSLADVKSVSPIPPVGLIQYQQIDKLMVYPIPTSGMLTIEIDALSAHDATLRVVNVLGQTMQQTQMPVANGKNYNKLNLSSLAKGVYFVELFTNNSKMVKRIVIE